MTDMLDTPWAIVVVIVVFAVAYLSTPDDAP
jgi:hypothetical protein